MTISELYTNEETGVVEEKILARQAIDINAVGEVLVWQPEFEIDCNADELVGNRFVIFTWGAIGAEEQPVVSNAITFTGTYKLEYKR